MSMKQYREDAAKSKQDVLSRNGFSPKSNEPEGMMSRSREIGDFENHKPTKAERRAKGGKVEKRMHGEKAKSRMDHFARGGHVKGKGKTTVNVVIAGSPGGGAARPVPVPVPAGPPPGGMPPPPPRPMPPPMGAAPPTGGPPGMAPPMRKRGGKVEKESKDCNGGMVKRAAGGSVGGRGKDGPDAPAAPKDAGAGSGVGRMEKNGKGEPKRLEHA